MVMTPRIATIARGDLARPAVDPDGNRFCVAG
jgi:hypothetical protein